MFLAGCVIVVATVLALNIGRKVVVADAPNQNTKQTNVSPPDLKLEYSRKRSLSEEVKHNGVRKKMLQERHKASKTNYSAFYNGNDDQTLPYSLVGEGGKITTASVEAARLTEVEKRDVQAVLDESFSSAEEDFLSRLVRVDSESDPELGVTVFSIPASPDRAEEILGRIRESMSSAIGPDRSAMLIKTFDIDNCVIGLGRKDVKIEVKTPPQGSNAITLIDYTFTDPDSGKISAEGQCSIRAFKLRFGDVIDFVDK